MKIFKKGVYYILALLMLSVSFSCEEDDQLNIIAGLDFNIAELNPEGNLVGVIATTIPPDGRIVYTVDFGDPNGTDIVPDDNDNPSDVVKTTSGPMVSYEYPEETATYTITVTASLPGRDDVSISKDYTVIFQEPEPDPTDNPFFGTWRLAPEAGALGVGPGQGDVSWWSNSPEDVVTRDCLFDDEYVFNADNTFQNVLGDQTWLEPWQGTDPEACGTPVFPHDGTASATYEFTSSELTINGAGAFMGLAKVVNGAELGAADTVPESRTYQYILSDDGLSLTLQIPVAGDGWWTFRFVKDAPPAPSALEGSWRLAPEAGAFGVGPGQGNVSWFSSSEEDITTRACLFDDEYVFNADGTFQNVLGSETWLEGWQGQDPEGCGTPVFPHDGTASATYDYDAGNNTLTINGTGAFLGLAKVFNGGELTNPSEAVESIEYIVELQDENTMIVDIAVAGDGWWRFKLVREAPPANPLVGTWRFAPEAGAFGVGPGQGNVSWFSSSSEDVTTRDCLFDDDYVFNADGTFENVLGSETWLEAWQGQDPDGCGTPVFPHDGSASATYTYDEGAGTVTINGTGAFLGLAKVFNGGELANPSGAVDSIEYIVEFENADTIIVDIAVEGDGWWRYKFVRQ
ncbi:hypothetical protein [Winogradskyella aquimaris]|uniref:PKD domain-containing protein n=1 Tax=Winogradskyella aquimaris TaxID=864074 RepID=A0ABU5EK33_9FLAO|nr:hypothetical protein [Winogradskyella aquimaris]MDY2585800.1 hypothetical protein [Winogradskyella aquimaris]